MSRRPSGKAWRVLLANMIAALAIVAIGGGFTRSLGLGPLVRAIGVSLIYANCVGTLLALTMPIVARHCFAAGARTRWLILFAAIAVVAVIGTCIANVILYAIGYIPHGRFAQWAIGSLSSAIIISLVIGGAVTAYESVRHRLDDATVALRTKERDEAEARRLAAEAQLASLESHVQPHFLFNTLNSIASLIHEDPNGAEKMTTELASLLRSSLDSQAPLVALDEELRVVRNYLEIERVRFGDRLRYDIELDPAVRERSIPRLAVQTLVENSVKFAVSPRREGANIAVRAFADGRRAHVEVEDDGPGFDVAAAPAGHGLALIRARLAMLFGDTAQLHVDSRPGRTVVSFDVPDERRVPQSPSPQVPEPRQRVLQSPSPPAPTRRRPS
jgi:signal transduction histidine kinase